jgi:hypothetical protein
MESRMAQQTATTPASHFILTGVPARAKFLATGRNGLYSAHGQLLANAVQALPARDITSAGLSMLAGQGLHLQPAVTLRVAATLAHLEQLLGACTAADRDYEQGGAVSAETIGTIRALLAQRSAA